MGRKQEVVLFWFCSYFDSRISMALTSDAFINGDPSTTASTRTSSTLFLYTPIYVLMHLPRTISVLNLLSTRIPSKYPSKFLQLQETSLSLSLYVCFSLWMWWGERNSTAQLWREDIHRALGFGQSAKFFIFEIR